jgi:homospermidine synthase
MASIPAWSPISSSRRCSTSPTPRIPAKRRRATAPAGPTWRADDAVLSLHELAGKHWMLQPRRRELGAADITSGMDELGVLLCGHARNAYWYGSRLSIDAARRLSPLNNATSLQTAAGVLAGGLAGVVWAMRHPEAGIVEPDEMDFREVLDVATPYLGEMVGVFSDWTPLEGRGALFAEDVDEADPWQFKNVLV